MSLIPPHGARLLGAWPTASDEHHHTRSRSTQRVRRSRLARVLHPLHRPVGVPASEPTAAPSITTARHA